MLGAICACFLPFQADIKTITMNGVYAMSALAAQLDLGNGSGPLQHNFGLNTRYAETNI